MRVDYRVMNNLRDIARRSDTWFFALGILILALALCVPTANAATITPAQAEQAKAIASAAFPNSPCTGRIVLTWDTSLHQNIQPNSPFGREGEAVIGDPGCRMSIYPGEAWNTCNVIVHEAGHLAGLDHDAGGIMIPNTAWAGCLPFAPLPVVAKTLTRRGQAILFITTDHLPKRFVWRVSCNKGTTRCVATARGAKARRFRVTADSVERITNRGSVFNDAR